MASVGIVDAVDVVVAPIRSLAAVARQGAAARTTVEIATAWGALAEVTHFQVWAELNWVSISNLGVAIGDSIQDIPQRLVRF